MENQDLRSTESIARFIAGTHNDDIPSHILEHAKVAFMDWLAVTLAGRDEPLVSKLIRYADLMGGFGQATILGQNLKKSVSQAALINGAMSHSLDYDDTMKKFLGHPSVTIFPGLLALCEWQGKSGLDFLTAYIVGLEAGACIGACAGIEHYAAGWHGTSTMGRLASASACAKLLGLNEQQTLFSLGIAGTQAAGLKRVLGTMCKPLHAGTASEGGLMAALLAQNDFDSAEDILEGPQGFFQAFKGAPNKTALESLGRTWQIQNLAQKYHASCHFTHSAIEAVLRISETEALKPEDINVMKIHTSQMGLDLAGKPAPTTGLEAKFSIPYCVANAFLTKDTGMQAFTEEHVNRPEIRALMKKTEVVVDPELDPMSLAAKAEMKINTGETHQLFVDVFEEIPDLETKKRKIEAKLSDVSTPFLGAKKTEELKEAISSMHRLPSVRKLLEIIKP